MKKVWTSGDAVQVLLLVIEVFLAKIVSQSMSDEATRL
jgi:hypothetical protein